MVYECGDIGIAFWIHVCEGRACCLLTQAVDVSILQFLFVLIIDMRVLVSPVEAGVKESNQHW